MIVAAVVTLKAAGIITAVVLIKRRKEEREWNRGTCPKCRKGKWEFCGTPTLLHSAENYKCSNPGCGNTTNQKFHANRRGAAG